MDVAVVAAAIGEPARARMLLSLLDGRARTSTELAAIADVSPSTASVHLGRLATNKLVRVSRQGKHHYYSLEGEHVANALEALCVVAHAPRKFTPNTPERLRLARTCYDHLAGTVSVSLRQHFETIEWLRDYEVTRDGRKGFESLGIDLAGLAGLRRRFAYGCLDWSERRPHIGGSLGAALLNVMLQRRWLTRDPDSRALTITRAGHRELHSRFAMTFD